MFRDKANEIGAVLGLPRGGSESLPYEPAYSPKSRGGRSRPYFPFASAAVQAGRSSARTPTHIRSADFRSPDSRLSIAPVTHIARSSASPAPQTSSMLEFPRTVSMNSVAPRP